MDEEFSMEDPTQLLKATLDFAHYLEVLIETATRDFLKLFPLPAIIKSTSTLPLLQIWNLKLRGSFGSGEFGEYKPLHSSVDAKLQAIYKSLADLQKQGKSGKSMGSSKRSGRWSKAGSKDAQPVANIANVTVESSLSRQSIGSDFRGCE